MSLSIVSLAQPCHAWFLRRLPQWVLPRGIRPGHLRRVQSPPGQTEGAKSRSRCSGQRQMFKVLTELRQQQHDCPTAARELKLRPACEGGKRWWKETQMTSPLRPEQGQSPLDFTPTPQGSSPVGCSGSRIRQQCSWEQGIPPKLCGGKGERLW